MLKLENRNLVYNSVNVDDAFDNFIHIFIDYCNHCCPLNDFTKSKQNTDKMWFIDALKNMFKKNKLYINYVKDPTLENAKK